MSDWELVNLSKPKSDFVELMAEFQRPTMRLQLGFIRDEGELSISHLQLESETGGINTVMLREIQFGELTTTVNVLARTLGKSLKLPDLATVDMSNTKSGAEQLVELARELGPVEGVPPWVVEEWPRGDLEVVFEWVDRIYSRALLTGEPPTAAVAEAFGKSHATGKRMVAAARKAGVLSVWSHYGPRSSKGSGTNGKKKASDR
ncbi:hypothetical protein [Corynebacterium hindlerae]|uniref:hypothetical protein n=1 Tax=Corynebacterium hindlerae TaxID=699041 RepID=UPI003AB0D637